MAKAIDLMLIKNPKAPINNTSDKFKKGGSMLRTKPAVVFHEPIFVLTYWSISSTT